MCLDRLLAWIDVFNEPKGWNWEGQRGQLSAPIIMSNWFMRSTTLGDDDVTDEDYGRPKMLIIQISVVECVADKNEYGAE